MSDLAPPNRLSEWWFQTRNRVLIHPSFQRWATRLPVLRWVAARRASALFGLVAGFVYSQVLFVGVQLGLFDALAAGPKTVDALATQLGLKPDAMRRLLEAAASLRLAEARPGDRFGLGIHGASLVGNPAVSALITHHALLYRDLADIEGLLRGTTQSTELERYWSYARLGPGAQSTAVQVGAYSALMANSMALIAEDILDAYPLGRHRHLMDLAGGEGAFVQAAARTAGLSLTLVDLPAVADRARARLADAGLSERVKVVGADLFANALPEGCDVVSFVRVIHDHDDAQALRLLQAARRALGPGGVLLIAEPMSGTAGAEPMGAAYFGFYLLAMGQGRPRTANELEKLALQAGFSSARLVTTRRPMLTRLMVAKA